MEVSCLRADQSLLREIQIFQMMENNGELEEWSVGQSDSNVGGSSVDSEQKMYTGSSAAN